MNDLSTADRYPSWDSLEGVPESGDNLSGLNRAGHDILVWVGERLPGFVLAAALAMLADWLAGAIGRNLFHTANSPLTGIPIAVLLGILPRNTIGIPSIFLLGIGTCLRQVQRIAIMLLGLRLSVAALGAIGFDGLPVAVVTVSAALLLVPWLGARVGLSRRLATLIAVGTSICGVSAIMATAPAIEAEESEVSYAVGCVVIFGLLAMLTYPLLAPLVVPATDRAIGIFLGTSIHDTAQVTGAALSYQNLHHTPGVLNVATVVKIIRNFSMAAVIPIMAALFNRGGKKSRRGARWTQFLPPFVIGFLILVVARTAGDAAVSRWHLLAAASWTDFLGGVDHTATWLLTVVMAAIGLGTGLKQLQKLGLRPLLVGFSAAATVGLISVGMIRLLHLVTP